MNIRYAILRMAVDIFQKNEHEIVLTAMKNVVEFVKTAYRLTAVSRDEK